MMMADEQPAPPQNWRLLVVALALGLIVMIIYNLHINKVRSAARGTTVRLARANQQIDQGRMVTVDMLSPVEVPADLLPLMGGRDALEWADAAGFLKDGKKILRLVTDGVLIHHSDFRGFESTRSPVPPGYVGVPIRVNPDRTPGELLTANSRVNVMAKIPSGRAGLLPTRILTSARVIGIGERAVEELPGGTDPTVKGQASFGRYTKITIAIPEAWSQQFERVLALTPETVWFEMLPTSDTYADPQLTPEAKALLPQGAAPPAP